MQENSGPGAARNKGLAEATGQYVCFLDADDELVAGSLPKRVQFLDENPDVGMVFTDLYRCRDKGDFSEVHLRDGGFLQKFNAAIVQADPPEYVFHKRYVRQAFEHTPFIKTPTVMVRKWVFDQVGLFDETLRAAEDIDLWLRIARQMPIGFIDEPLTCWNNFYSSLTAETDRFFRDTLIFYKNQSRFASTSAEERQLLRLKIAQLLFNFGYHLFEQKRCREARSLFIEALGYRLIDGRTLKCLGFSFLPHSMLTILKQLKRRFSPYD